MKNETFKKRSISVPGKRCDIKARIIYLFDGRTGQISRLYNNYSQKQNWKNISVQYLS